MTAGNKEKHKYQKTIRVPEVHSALLEEEAKGMGIGKPAVLLRMIIIERLKRGDLDLLAAHADERPAITAASPRLGVYFTEAEMKTVDKAAKKVSAGEFNAFVRAILTEHYAEKS